MKMIRILTAAVCAFILAAIFVSSASAVTYQEIGDYAASLIGTPAKEWGGGPGTQCVELPKFFLDCCYGLNTKEQALGNGNDFYINVAARYPQIFQRIDYYDGFVPMPGDIISFESETKPTLGHTAVVCSVNGDRYMIAEQWRDSGTVWSRGVTVAPAQYGVSYTIIGVARPYAQESAAWNFNKPVTYPEFSELLKKGAKDDEAERVSFAQTCLGFLGYDCGKEDGVFGEKTEKAVKDFQRACDADATGKLDGDTWKMLSARAGIADIGSGFYAYILGFDDRMNIENTNGAVCVAENSDKLAPEQIWRFDLTADGTYKVTNAFDGKILDIDGGKVSVRGSENSLSQQWVIFYNNGTASYGLRSCCGKCVLDFSGKDGRLNVRDFSDEPSQHFVIYPLGNDGRTFEVPEKPDAPEVKAENTGKSSEPVKLTWSESPLKSVYDARSYTVKIEKDGAVYKTVNGITANELKIKLPAGKYTAQVCAVNTRFADMISEPGKVSFAVEEHTHKFGKYTVVTPATFSADGEKTRKCSVCGTVEKKKIAAISGWSVEQIVCVYDGTVKNPSATVTDTNGKLLRENTDYKLRYEAGRKDPGVYDVHIIFTGDYSGSSVQSFIIRPAQNAKSAPPETAHKKLK